MAAPAFRRIASWIFQRVLWDPSGVPVRGFGGSLWALRKVLLALAGSAVLTWQEWRKDHPPEIVIVAVLHFVFVLAAIALLVYAAHSLRGRNQPTPR